MISRNNTYVKDLFEEYMSMGEEEDIKYSSFENLFDDVDIFINEIHKTKGDKNLPHTSIQTLINMLQAIDPQDHNIYSQGGWEYSLITGDYDEPSDGHMPLFLANYFEIKNEKTNKSNFLIEIKDNAGGAYYRPDERERLILDDYFIKFEDAQSVIDEYFKEATG